MAINVGCCGGAQNANPLANALHMNGQNGMSQEDQLADFVGRAADGKIGAGCRKSGGVANSRTPADTARLQKLAQMMGFKDCGCGCKGAKAVIKLLQKMKAQETGQGGQEGGCSSCGGGKPGQAQGMPKGWEPGLDANAMRYNEAHTNRLLGASGGPSGPQGGGSCCGGPPVGGPGGAGGFRCMGFPGGNALPSGCCCGGGGGGGRVTAGLEIELRAAMDLV